MLFGITTLAFAANNPTAPATLDGGQSSTFNTANYQAQTIYAYAGNITAIVLHGVGQTKAWQGYYGNITATVTLDDANNFTFYNWSDAEPRGQIYATLNSTITWATVDCFNFTGTVMNETVIENYYSIQTDNVDGVPETYNSTYPLVQVADRNLTSCPSTFIFQNDTAQQTNFVNLLLWDTADVNSGWIYSTIIENKSVGGQDMDCYNGQYCDFQIIVNEDGHHADTSTTTYYFWVELS